MNRFLRDGKVGETAILLISKTIINYKLTDKTDMVLLDLSGEL